MLLLVRTGNFMSWLKIECNNYTYALFAGPFTITHSRYQVVDFSSVFMIDTSPFILPFKTEVDLFVLIKPFTEAVWIIVLLVIPVYWIMMGLSDLLYDGNTLWVHWVFLLDFVFRHLFKQAHKLTQKLSAEMKYSNILRMNWVIGAFIITTLYSGKRDNRLLLILELYILKRQ